MEGTVEGEEGKRSAGVPKLPEERTERDRADLAVTTVVLGPLRGAEERTYSSSSLTLAELKSSSDSLSRCAHALTRGRATLLLFPIARGSGSKWREARERSCGSEEGKSKQE